MYILIKVTSHKYEQKMMVFTNHIRYLFLYTMSLLSLHFFPPVLFIKYSSPLLPVLSTDLSSEYRQ